MLKKLVSLVMSLVLVVFISACSSEPTEKSFMDYKTEFIGDNSAVINLVQLLPYSEYYEGTSLQTEKEPYGLTVDYDFYKNGIKTDKEFKASLEKSAVVFFALVDNADKVRFNTNSIVSKAYLFDRVKLEEKYGDLSELFETNEDIVEFLGEPIAPVFE